LQKLILILILFIFSIFSQAKELQKVSLQFHWLDQFEFAGYYIAKEKGFYEDVGLAVEFKTYKYGMDVTKELTSGNATYAIGGSDLILDISNGADISMLAAIFQSSPLILLTTGKSGIKSIKDFKNKKVMLTPDTLNSVTFNAMLKKEGVSFSDMNIVKHSFDINDLINNKVELFQSYSTNEPYSLKQANIKPIIFDPKDYGFDFYSEILFTSNDEIKNHKKRVAAFKEASLKGWKYAFSNIEESVDIIYHKYNSQNRTKEALLFEANESKKLAYYENKPLGEISVNKIERMHDAYNILNLINKPLDINRYIFKENNLSRLVLTSDEKEFIKNNPTLIISNENDYPPYDFFENGEAKGYSVDLIKLLANKLGFNIKFETDTWANLVDKFCAGKIDILHPTDKSKKVIQCAKFTTPIIKDTSQFLIRSDFKKVNTIKDLYGYTIATPKFWQQTEYFKNNYKNKLKILEVKNTLEAIEKVRLGEADFAYDYGNVLRYLKSKHNFNGVKVEGVYAKDSSLDNLYIAVDKNKNILKNIFQKAIDAVEINEIKTLQNRWFGEDYTPNAMANLTDKEKEFIRKHPNIKLGYSFLSQPVVMKSKDDDIVEGFAVDLARNIRNQTGLNIEFEEGVWKDIVKKAQNRELDGLAVTVSQNENRKKYFNFTSAYMTQTPVVFVRKGNPQEIENLASLKGKKMAILRGVEAMEDMADKFGAQKVYFDDIREVIDSVISKKSDFSIFFENIFFIANSLGLNYIELAFAVSKPLDAFFSVRNDYPELKSIIDKVMNTIPAYELINSKNIWFDENKIFSKISFLEEEKEYLNKKKKINLCVHSNFLPYEKVSQNGKYEGVTSDIFNLFHINSGIDFNLVKTKDWSESLEFVESRKCDVLTLAMKTPKREKYLDFTTSYIDSPFVVLTKSDEIFVDKIETILNKQIAISKDHATIDFLKAKYPKINIRIVKDIKEGVKLVQKGEVYGYINTLSSIAYYIQKHSLLDVKINGKFDEKATLSIATRNDEPLLQNIMQKLIDSVGETTKDQIYNKWISVVYEKDVDYSLLWKVVGLFLFLALLLLYRVKLLRDNKIKLEKMIKKEIEESRRKDNLIFQQNKMASLGNMIATIAHQWRQPLAQLSMSQNIILRQIQTDTFSKEDLEDIVKDDQKVVQFMSQTINTFQNFYKDDFDEEIFTIASSYEDVKYILSEPIALNKIELIENIDYSIQIEACKNFITQVLLSILQNSVYFLKQRKIESPKIYIKIEKIDKQIIIEIDNNDKGIDEKVIDKIFDYSFSRRDTHQKSTGLGLYIVKLIVEEKFKGKIEAKNTKDGAKFIISFVHNL